MCEEGWSHVRCSHCNKLCLAATTRLPRGLSGEEPACQRRRHRRHGCEPWVGKVPWRRRQQPTPVLLAGEPHGQRSLAGPSPQHCTEVDTAEHKRGRQLLGWPRHSFGLVHRTQRRPQRTSGANSIEYLPQDFPGLGRSTAEGKGYPLQYSGEIHGVTKSQTQLRDF